MREFHRQSIRLHGFSYAQPGYYFVTICTQNRTKLFVPLVGADPCVCPDTSVRPDSRIRPHDMVETWWNKIPCKFPNTRMDTFVIMPDHVHGIIQILDPLHQSMGGHMDPLHQSMGGHMHPSHPSMGRHMDPSHPSMGGHMDPLHQSMGGHMGPPLREMIQWFKTMTTNDYIRGVRSGHYPPFDRRLWQRNYWERVIRNERELQNVREYILDNPKKLGTPYG